MEEVYRSFDTPPGVTTIEVLPDVLIIRFPLRTGQSDGLAHIEKRLVVKGRVHVDIPEQVGITWNVGRGVALSAPVGLPLLPGCAVGGGAAELSC